MVDIPASSRERKRIFSVIVTYLGERQQNLSNDMVDDTLSVLDLKIFYDITL